MRWMKIDEACKYAGGVSRKTVYAAIRAGRLQAARIGAGRNLVVSDVAIDQMARAVAWRLQPGRRTRTRRTIGLTVTLSV